MKNHAELNTYDHLADLAYACSLMKKIPRSGFAFLGSGSESIADHSFGATSFAFILAKMAGANIEKTVCLCLFHDLHESATGDFNYVNHRYDKCDQIRALEDILGGTGLEDELIGFLKEFEDQNTTEAMLARDADQLDMICSLREEFEHGNKFAGEWLRSAVKRIHTAEGEKLCAALLNAKPWRWWYDKADLKWWIDRNATGKDHASVNKVHNDR